MRFVSIALLVLVLPSLAHASEGYPYRLETYVPMPMRPDCSLCHIARITTYDSVRTPFGVSMRSRGLIAGDSSSLYKAIDRLRAENVDSDADGVPDVEELAIGSDPNGPDDAYRQAHYGCGVTRAGAGAQPSDIAFGLALVAVAAAWARRERRLR